MVSEKLVQYVILRRDLLTELKWPIGSLVAQACHACVACLKLYHNERKTINYLNDIPNMTKIVLEVRDEAQLREVENNFIKNGIMYYTWFEQPEEIKTCIATIPYLKEEIKPFLSTLPLFK